MIEKLRYVICEQPQRDHENIVGFEYTFWKIPFLLEMARPGQSLEDRRITEEDRKISRTPLYIDSKTGRFFYIFYWKVHNSTFWRKDFEGLLEINHKV